MKRLALFMLFAKIRLDWLGRYDKTFNASSWAKLLQYELAMKIVAIILSLSITCTSSIAGAVACSHRIIFLPQTHLMDGEDSETYSPTIMDDAARSQYKISQYIDNHRGIPVFSEQAAAVDYDWQNLSVDQRAGILAKVRRIFPKGFPSRFESLSAEQRLFIVNNGGDFLALYRQDIAHIHRVIKDQETADKIFSVTDQWMKDHPGHLQVYSPEVEHLVFDVRESLALDEINRYFALHPTQQDVILMFGSQHNFQDHPNLFNPACFVLPSDFESDVTMLHHSQPATPVAPEASTSSR